ncbi:protein S40-5-like [Prosopis cineraria]|uniref:protein S40-5 n=1 Tax=Prosopis cineraria TaxID=364024 RepID=UPI00241054C2|nr:protein S40-5 [Prosopis cineraria]XP_054791483.1 protein S40-5-like [Prosopis cineraria]
MAKGRKLTISQSERFLGSYANSYAQGFNASDGSELGEADVWSAADDAGESAANAPPRDWEPRVASENNGSSSMRSRRGILSRHFGGLSLSFEDSTEEDNATTSSMIVHQYRGNDSVASQHGHHMATSAPVNVPDWSKILRVNSVESMQGADDISDDENESEMVPPHEYLAREYARSRKTAANSVFEGVGRTLKGRDLRRVRDAVWSQTGFDG